MNFFNFEFMSTVVALDHPIISRHAPQISLPITHYPFSQYVKGAITANDLVRTYEQEVAAKMAGIDLQDVVEAALETIPNKRKRDLLSTAR